MIEEVKQSKEALAEEAIRRMKMLQLPENIIAEFEKNGKLMLSDCYSSEVPEDILQQIKAWEEKFGNLVYHVIHTKWKFETYECLSVSAYKSDWEYERNLIEDPTNQWPMAFCINKTIPEFTESGSIKVKNNTGILERIN